MTDHGVSRRMKGTTSSGIRIRLITRMLLTVLVVLAVVPGASAHFTENTRHLGIHAWKEFIGDRVYTRQQINSRTYTRSQADGLFPTRTELDAHKGSADHDGRYYTKALADARYTATYCSQAAALPFSFPSAPCSKPDKSLSTVDSPGEVGLDSSIAIGTDGNPTISYYDLTNKDLKVVHCDDSACTAAEHPQTVDATGEVGRYTSIAIGTDGNPTVSYQDATNGNLKVVHCDDPACAGTETPLTVDSGGAYTSIAIAPDGNPTISYFDNSGLRVVHCNGPSCHGGKTPHTVDAVPGRDTSIAIAPDGNPTISYYDFTNKDLKVVHCDDPECAPGGESTQTVDSDGDVGEWTSIAIAPDGNPVVSYHDATNGALKVVHCNDPACAGTETPQTVHSGLFGALGTHTSIAIGTDGHPIVSYHDDGDNVLWVVHCNDPACASGDEIPQAVDQGNCCTSVAIGTDGNPTVSYYGNQDLMVARFGI